MTETPQPPAFKYRLTLTIHANSHDEILNELLMQTQGAYGLGELDRDSWHILGGRRTESVLEHTNPAMTPEEYGIELDEWHANRKANRA